MLDEFSQKTTVSAFYPLYSWGKKHLNNIVVCVQASLGGFLHVHLLEPLLSPLAENASKVRMALVRGHSVALVSLLQRRAQETTGRMQQWLEEHYQAEMKR